MDEQIKEVLNKCSVSTRVTAKTFFPERFSLPFAEQIHGEIFDLIDGPAQKVAIAAPRGWGKTSIVALALIARWILFRHAGFVVYINKSHDAAALQTENLRRELVTNREIKAFFGDLKSRRVHKSEFDEVFSKKAWVAYDTLVWPRGAGQQVRGVLYRNDRPGLIVVDDMEDSDQVENEEYRHKVHEWLYADVIKALPRIGPQAKLCKVVYIDTLKHADSTLQKLLDSPEWKSVRLEACNDDFKSTAPEFMTDEEIADEWQKHVDAGQTDVFFRELRNLPISTKDSAFQQAHFKYYNLGPEQPIREGIDLKKIDPDLQHDRNIETVIIGDPAKTAKMNSADSAIVGVGIDLSSARFYLRDIECDKMYPDEFYDTLFGMGTRLNAKVMGIEVTGLEEFIKQPTKNYMFRSGKFFELVWLKARGGDKTEKGKSLRIKGLVPYYRQGYIYHNAACPLIRKLEQQLLMFPRSKLWDIMDAFAYIVEMLELGERYFSPIEDPNDVDAEYKELDYDKPVDNWRFV